MSHVIKQNLYYRKTKEFIEDNIATMDSPHIVDIYNNLTLENAEETYRKLWFLKMQAEDKY
jgi:hypothetical protein